MAGLTASFQREANRTVFDGLKDIVPYQLWSMLTEIWPTNGVESQTYEWLGQWDEAREFVGPRRVQSLYQHSVTFGSRLWEITTGWDRLKVKDNLIWEMLRRKISQLPSQWANIPEKLLLSKMVSDTDTLTIDGVTFFSSLHPIEGSTSTNSNIISGTGVTAAAIKADWSSLKQAIQAIENRDGTKLYKITDRLKYVIVHAPALADPIREVFIDKQMGVAADGAAIQGYHSREDVTPVSWGGLSGNDWYVFVVNLPIHKPFLYMNVIDAMFEFDETKGFENNMIYYGGVGRFDVHYGDWRTAFKVDN